MLIVLLFVSVFAKLELVIEVSRHGSRTPLDLLDWSHEEEAAKLVEQGRAQHKKIGEHVRDYYVPLLQSELPEDIYVRSSESSRTLESAKVQLEAILGSEGEIDSVPSEDDYMLRPQFACPRISYLMKRDRFSTSHYTDIMNEAEQHKEEIVKLAGTDWDIFSLYAIGDNILSYEDRGIPIPIEISQEVRALGINAYHRYNDKLLFGSKDQGKLGTFQLLKRMLDYIDEVKNHRKPHNIGIYITHDSVLIALLRMLGFEYPSVPASSVLFIEIHSDPDGLFYKFVFNSELLESPECGFECRDYEMEANLKKRMMKSDEHLKRACKVVDDAPQSSWTKLVIPIVVGFGLFMFFKFNTQGAIWLVNRMKKEN